MISTTTKLNLLTLFKGGATQTSASPSLSLPAPTTNTNHNTITTDFLTEIKKTYSDFELVELIPRTDIFVGYGNSNGAGLFFLLDQDLKLITLNYIKADGTSEAKTILNTFNYNGEEISLPKFDKLKMTDNYLIYGLVTKNNNLYFYRFADFLTTYYKNVELFLINELQLNVIDSDSEWDNTSIINSPCCFDIPSNDEETGVVVYRGTNTDYNPYPYVLVVNILNLTDNEIKYYHQVVNYKDSLQGTYYSLDLDGLSNLDIKTTKNASGEYSTCFFGNVKGVMNTATLTTTDNVNTDAGVAQMPEQSADAYPIQQDNTKTVTLTTAKNAINNYRTRHNYNITVQPTTFSFKWGYYRQTMSTLRTTDTQTFTGSAKSFSKPSDLYLNIRVVSYAYFSTMTNWTASGEITLNVNEGYNYNNNYGTTYYNSTSNDARITTLYAVGLTGTVTTTHRWLVRDTSKTTNNSIFILKITSSSSEATATLHNYQENITGDINFKLQTASAGFVCFNNGIYSFSTSASQGSTFSLVTSFEATPTINLTNTTDEITTPTIVGVYNTGLNSSITLGNENWGVFNLYSTSETTIPNASALATSNRGFYCENVYALRQQNAIFIYGFNADYTKATIWTQSYNNSYPKSQPYFFNYYKNTYKDFWPIRIKGFYDTWLTADVDVENFLINSNTLLVSGFLRATTMNEQNNNFWVIQSQTNTPIFETNYTSEKTADEIQQENFLITLNFYNYQTNTINSSFSKELINLFSVNNQQLDLDVYRLNKIRLNFKNGNSLLSHFNWITDEANNQIYFKIYLKLNDPLNPLQSFNLLNEKGDTITTSEEFDVTQNKQFYILTLKVYFMDIDYQTKNILNYNLI